MRGLGGFRERLARLARLIGEPQPEPTDPRLAQVFLAAVPTCSCPYRGPHTCGHLDDRASPGDPPDPDAEWLKPAWEAVHAAMEAIEADPDWSPTPTPRDDEDDDDGAL